MALPTYPMERAGAKVGVALVISMEANREGAARDRGVLEALFKHFQFQVEGPWVDYPADLLKSSIKKLAKQTSLLEAVDCFVCSVNAHGGTGDGKGYIMDSTVTQSEATSSGALDQVTSTGIINLIDDIINPFCDSKLLKGKPKVFLINACRGNTLPSRRGGGRNAKETSFLSEEKMGDYIHNKDDLYLVFSTDEGEQSLRVPRQGTLFVECLQLVLEARLAFSTVPQLMDVVADEMRKMGRALDNNVQQIVCKRTYLTKQLYWSYNAPIQYGGFKRLDTLATHDALLRKQVEALKTLLDLDEPQKTCHVLLWGMGGVGKSVTVKGLHDDPEIESYFQGAIAFEELGEKPYLAAPQIQSDILKLITSVHGQTFGDDAAGADVLRQELRNRRVLLILDNVWEGDSLDTLEKLSFRLPAGSRVVVTSRSKLRFSRTRWGENVIYKEQRMDELPAEEAQDLLRWRVENLWPDAGPPASFEKLIRPLADACAGLPLALDIVGAWLFECCKDDTNPATRLQQWKSTLGTIRQSLDLKGGNEPEVFRILRSSYDSLGPEEQEMFLNTVAFVPGQPLWEESLCYLFIAGLRAGGHERTLPDAQRALQNLERRSLLKIGGHPNLPPIVIVHDLLRELAGRNVDKEEYKERKRLFMVGKAVDPRLASTQLGAAVCLSLSGSGDLKLEDENGKPWRMFEPGGAPHLLAARFDQVLIRRVPAEIRNWQKTLRLLDLSNCVCLVDLPDEIGDLSELRVFSVASCKHLRSLPSSMSKLTKLCLFDARGCWSLASLPQSFGELSMFKDLWLWRATSIKVERRGSVMISLPVVDGRVVQLEEQLVGIKPLVWIAQRYDRDNDFVDGRASVLSEICVALDQLYDVKDHYNALLDEGVITVLAAIGGRKREEHAAQQLAEYGTRWRALHALWSFALADSDTRFCEALLEPNVIDILLRIARDSTESPDHQTQVAGIWRSLASIRPEVAVMLRKLGAVDALLELVKGSSNHAQVYQYGLSALCSFGEDPESLTLMVDRGGLAAALDLIARGISGECTVDAIRLLTFLVHEPRCKRALASDGSFVAAACSCLSINGPWETYGLMLAIILDLLSDPRMGLLRFLPDARVNQLVRALVDGTARGWSEQIVCTELAYELLELLGPGRVALRLDEATEPTSCSDWSRERVAEFLGRTTISLRPRLEALFLLVACQPEVDSWLHDPASAALVQSFLYSCLQEEDLSQLAAAVLHKVLALRNSVPGRAGPFVSTLSAPVLRTLTAMLNADKASDGKDPQDPQENVLLALDGITDALGYLGEEDRQRFHAAATESGLLPALEDHTKRLQDKLGGAQMGRVRQQAEGDNLERWTPSAEYSERAMWTLRDCFVPFECSSIVEAWNADWEFAMMGGNPSSAVTLAEHEFEDFSDSSSASGDLADSPTPDVDTPGSRTVSHQWWKWVAIVAAVSALWTALKCLADLVARYFVTRGGPAAVLEETVMEAAEDSTVLPGAAAALAAAAVGVMHCVQDGAETQKRDQPDVTPAGLLQRLQSGPSLYHFQTLQQLAELLQRQDPVPYETASATKAVAVALVKGALQWGSDVRCLALVGTLLRALAHRPNAPPLRTIRGDEPVAHVTEDRVRVLLGFIQDGSAPEHILPRLEELYILAGCGKPCAGYVVEAGGLEALMWVVQCYPEEGLRRLAAAITGTILVHVEDTLEPARLFCRISNGPASFSQFLLGMVSKTGETAWLFALESLAEALGRRGCIGRGVWLAAFGQCKQRFKAVVTRLEQAAEQGGSGALEAAAKSAVRAYSLLLEPDVVPLLLNEVPLLRHQADFPKGRAGEGSDDLPPQAVVANATAGLGASPPAGDPVVETETERAMPISATHDDGRASRDGELERDIAKAVVLSLEGDASAKKGVKPSGPAKSSQVGRRPESGA